MEYIKELKGNSIARKVKIADIMYNSYETRLDEINIKDIERISKYKKALEILKY